MLESGLFFTLGFLAAALLALMIAPAIWRRAVVLTRQRIESSVPLTLNEIQADKDQLRAEFAMSTRRLEVSLEDLKERAAEQMIEINRRRDEVLALEDVQSNKEERITELQSQSDELRSDMRNREEKLSQASLKLANVEAALEEKLQETEKLERRYQEVVGEFDDQKMELVASETKLDNAGDEMRTLKENLKKFRDGSTSLEEEKKAADINLRREKDRNLELEKKVGRLQSSTADMEARLERRDLDIKKLREKFGASDNRASSNDGQLNKVQAENVKLKAELAEAAQKTEALLKDASNENVESAVAVFDRERSELQAKLEKIEQEKQSLQEELSAVQLSSGEDWEVERRENAIVRERINDLAAQVTAMTASIEGPDSPINTALAQKAPKLKAVATDTNLQNGTDDGEVRSLADRIRALQQEAEKTG